jgi:predicted DNA-binding protein
MPSQHRAGVKVVAVRLDEELIERFHAAAAAHGEGRALFLQRALEERIDRIEQQNGAQSP